MAKEETFEKVYGKEINMFELYYVVNARAEEFTSPKRGFCKVPALPQKGNIFIIKDYEFEVSNVYFEYAKDDDAYMPTLILK